MIGYCANKIMTCLSIEIIAYTLFYLFCSNSEHGDVQFTEIKELSKIYQCLLCFYSIIVVIVSNEPTTEAMFHNITVST